MCPYEEKPDCFNCPFSDCKADTRDLSRQLAVERAEARKERDRIIVEAYLKGADTEGLAERFGFSGTSNVCRILKRAGIDCKKIRKERK